MAISGGMKIFKESKALYGNGDSAIASTGSSSANFILDTNRFTFWRSVGSSDATTETFVVDDEKHMMQFIATEEIHTFDGYPDFKPKHSRNIRKHKMMSGRTRIEKSEESFTGKIGFKDYDPNLADDIDTAYFLVDSEDPFILWACGGKRELSNDGCFRYQQKGWRLEDFYTCHVTRDISPNYKSNYYGGSLNLRLSIEETT